MNFSKPLYLSLLNRLGSNWNLKLLMLLMLPTITTGAYLIVQRVILFPVRSVPLTWLDGAIPFNPHWAWAYVSLYLLNPIGPLLTRSRDDLARYTRGVLFLFGVGLVCFVFFPVAAPRPYGGSGDWIYDRVIRVDRVYNSIPSLHAGCAVYAVLFAAYAFRDSTRPALRSAVLFVGWIWVGLILYSTVATRQHFAIDLLPGAFLGWLAYKLFSKRAALDHQISAAAYLKSEAA